MKPKTIAELLRDYGLHYYDPNAPREDAFKLIGDDAVEELVSQIQQLLEECAPEEKEWPNEKMTFEAGLASGHNSGISQYKSNIREKLK